MIYRNRNVGSWCRCQKGENEPKTSQTITGVDIHCNPTICVPSGSSEILPEGIKMVGLERTSADALDFHFWTRRRREKKSVFSKVKSLFYNTKTRCCRACAACGGLKTLLHLVNWRRRRKNGILPCETRIFLLKYCIFDVTRFQNSKKIQPAMGQNLTLFV